MYPTIKTRVTKVATIAATDYVKSYTDQIRAFVRVNIKCLGTDGYDRFLIAVKIWARHFEVDHWLLLLIGSRLYVELVKAQVTKIKKLLVEGRN